MKEKIIIYPVAVPKTYLYSYPRILALVVWKIHMKLKVILTKTFLHKQ